MLRPTLEDRKIFLAEVAAKIFAQKGYKTASLQDVAEKAHISKAGVYHYFKTKEDILFYLIKIKHDKFLEVLKTCIKECRDNELGPEKTFQKLFYAYAYVATKWSGEPRKSEEGEVKWLPAEALMSVDTGAFPEYNTATLTAARELGFL